MSTGIWAAASGMVGQQSALDVAAGNIANATTPGFRADRALFRQTLVAASRSVPSQSLRYAVTRTVEPDKRPGQIVQTGQPLDVALRNKDDLFVVSTPQGVRYTRAGSFQIGADGRLTTAGGAIVLGPDQKPVKVPSDANSVKLSPTGELLVNGELSGPKLMVVSFARPEALQKEGAVLLRGTPGAGRAVEKDPDLATESLELSNASALEGMTTLVTATREFEMMSKVVEAFSEIERKAASDIIGGR
ncbi:MAG TPA: flagellar hook basal-body protein [Polyangiaceae bacterium]|nr:flagellar hook basal-body protein [Polyangiaceae bacterium]